MIFIEAKIFLMNEKVQVNIYFSIPIIFYLVLIYIVFEIFFRYAHKTRN